MKKKIFAFLLALVLPLAGCAALTGSNQPAGYRQVSAQEAMDMMAGQEDYLILDVRTQAEYDGGHIPGAISLPNEDIGREDPPQLPLKDQLILVYCRSGNRSKQASDKLAALGYTNVVEFGGINTWPGDIIQD